MLRDHKKVKMLYLLKFSALGSLFIMNLLDAHENYIRSKDELEWTGHTTWDNWKHFSKLSNFLDKITSEKEA